MYCILTRVRIITNIRVNLHFLKPVICIKKNLTTFNLFKNKNIIKKLHTRTRINNVYIFF